MVCACDRYAIATATGRACLVDPCRREQAGDPREHTLGQGARRSTIQRSGGEALDDPVRSLAPVTQPVMQPVGAPLPELDNVMPEPVAAPEAGHGHYRARRPSLLEPRITVVEHGTGSDHRRLPACPRPELGAMRAGMEIWLAFPLGQWRDRALDDDLASQRVPGE